jgi:predicted SnoaL-like aldol condensation-catalyzing enzyme
MFDGTFFSVISMDYELLFEVPENDAHRLRKEAAVRFLSLIGAGRPKDGLVFFTPDCITHNPYTAGDMDALTDAMIAVQKSGSAGVVKGSTADFKLSVRQVLAEGDLVAVHTTLSSSNPLAGGLRQIHLFRFEGDKIVEYWDITQFIPEGAPNAAGAFS